ncbi:hypothetical protein HF650_22475 [Kosakonia sp. SMBL-WEM22]|uniref:hypothetical protein n=1 Tax=Kosakonia sp. SMBL-WEM22 TaxID=2725560 RepID=UPI001659C693|nr:hypothetical protein [Kosakonia sp. SMBL-WEM22]QNQ22289.1 hypothetical protein HF650_22475 [Kosakonia sp. SMBL-WEM22]
MFINKPEDVLVIIKKDQLFYWFAAFKEMWIMDRVKWVADFIQNGIVAITEGIHEERNNIPILNERNGDVFISLLKRDHALYNRDEIANEFYERLTADTTWWNIDDLMPDLFIDFDSKALYSQYVESMHYEKYVPKGWKGQRIDFCDTRFLDIHECYWIKNGLNYRAMIMTRT